MAEATLEEMAQALQHGRDDLAKAEAERARLYEPYIAASNRCRRLEEAIKLIEKGLESAKYAHAVRQALEERGIETEAQSVIFVELSEYTKHWYRLAAIGPEGAPLYLFTPERSHRYQGREYAITAREDVELGWDGLYGHQVRWPGEMRAVGLMPWWERGNGSFGRGTGSVKPCAPPEGGRWRWLKVKDQQLLEGGKK